MKMLPVTLRTTLILGLIFYFILILIFLKNKSLLLKYALLWVLAGIVLGGMVIFPDMLVWITRLLGIESNMNGLFVLCIGFIIIILMALTSIVSRQTNRIRILVQANAILEKRVRELEKSSGYDGMAKEG
ncbi:DUF2304 domain-containing protein [bacterium C-53]|nr:DUF2304 domain-containing protein [Lachnospiraceae bacterium]NBI02648.1 DUF2304 domain-containing protein [Lachnospiraceae bacterium]RKJ11286.1 DUF2304 domain-containing protein [bacterium C-53]